MKELNQPYNNFKGGKLKKVKIFAGRFQPFHYGHLEVFEKSIEKLKEHEILILAAISPFQMSHPADAHFAKIAEEHHQNNRNPWGIESILQVTNKIVQVYSNEHKNKKIITTLIPRPDYGWDVITRWFNCERIWIIPNAQEEFDDEKEKFFLSKGDNVLRYQDTQEISGWDLRNSFYQDNITMFKKHVPDFLHDIYLT